MFCGNCGKELENGMKYCIYCGAPTRGPARPDPDLARTIRENDLKRFRLISIILLVVTGIDIFFSGVFITLVDDITLLGWDVLPKHGLSLFIIGVQLLQLATGVLGLLAAATDRWIQGALVFAIITLVPAGILNVYRIISTESSVMGVTINTAMLLVLVIIGAKLRKETEMTG